MAGRKKMKMVVKSLPVDEARALVTSVLELKKKLGYTYKQMAEEVGCGVFTFQNAKSVWLSKKNKRFGRYKNMKPSVANKFIQFWNLHLTNKPTNKKVGKLKPIAVQKRSSEFRNQTTPANLPVKVLISKVGFDVAARLLEKEGKTEALEKYLKTLSTEELLKLI